jgi:hypothetical protein
VLFSFAERKEELSSLACLRTVPDKLALTKLQSWHSRLLKSVFDKFKDLNSLEVLAISLILSKGRTDAGIDSWENNGINETQTRSNNERKLRVKLAIG